VPRPAVLRADEVPDVAAVLDAVLAVAVLPGVAGTTGVRFGRLEPERNRAAGERVLLHPHGRDEKAVADVAGTQVADCLLGLPGVHVVDDEDVVLLRGQALFEVVLRLGLVAPARHTVGTGVADSVLPLAGGDFYLEVFFAAAGVE